MTKTSKTNNRKQAEKTHFVDVEGRERFKLISSGALLLYINVSLIGIAYWANYAQMYLFESERHQRQLYILVNHLHRQSIGWCISLCPSKYELWIHFSSSFFPDPICFSHFGWKCTKHLCRPQNALMSPETSHYFVILPLPS